MTAIFERFEIDMPEACVLDCSHSGPCDDDVNHWLPRLALDLNPADLRAELKGYGAWDDDELSNHEDNLRRILWIAACNINEEPKDQPPC